MATRTRRPRGHIEERPNGTFRAIVYAGIDPLTKKPRYLKRTTATYAEAEVELTKLQNQVDERRHPRTNITIGQAVTQWLEVARLEDTTRERYEDLIRLYIEPAFGTLPAGRLDAELLERFYARLTACRELCSGRRRSHSCRPLANNTVRKIHFIIRASLDRAVRWRYLGINEATLAEPPAFEKGEPDPPSAAEAAKLLNEAWWRDPEWGLLLWLTMITGSRRGEICGLRWSHIDLERNLLWIEDSSAQTRAGVQNKKTKTHQQRRLAIDDHTAKLLAEHRERCENRCALLDIKLAADAYIFSLEPDGSTSLLPRSVTQRYRRLAQSLGLRSTRLHSLRHYAATELIDAGVNLRTVAGRLGHGGGGATTLRVYAAWVDESDRRAADTLAAIVPRPDPTSRQPRSPYEKIAAGLRDDLLSGRLRAGQVLPTVVELASAHGVSAGTAQRAIAVLRAEGLVDVARGRRAVIRSPEGEGIRVGLGSKSGAVD